MIQASREFFLYSHIFGGASDIVVAVLLRGIVKSCRMRASTEYEGDQLMNQSFCSIYPLLLRPCRWFDWVKTSISSFSASWSSSSRWSSTRSPFEYRRVRRCFNRSLQQQTKLLYETKAIGTTRKEQADFAKFVSLGSLALLKINCNHIG